MLWLSLLIGGALAHEPEAVAATVTLRTGHVTVDVSVDYLAWLQALAPPSSGPVPLLVLSDPDALEALVATAATRIATSEVVVDGVARPFDRVRLPTASEAQTLAVTWLHAQSESTHAHGHAPIEWVTLTLEATLHEAPEHIGLALPPSLGAVHYTFVEPVTAFVPAGAPASFSVGGTTGR